MKLQCLLCGRGSLCPARSDTMEVRAVDDKMKGTMMCDNALLTTHSFGNSYPCPIQFSINYWVDLSIDFVTDLTIIDSWCYQMFKLPNNGLCRNMFLKFIASVII